MGNKCCKSQSSTYSSANATIRSFSSYNSSVVRPSGRHAITFETSSHGDSLTTLAMKSSNQSDVGQDYRGGSSSTIGQDDPIPIFLRRLNDLNIRVGTRTRFLIELDDSTGVQVRWYHNNLEADSDRYQYIHEGGFYCLDIVPVTLEDEGLWVCTVQNYAGKSSTAAHLSLIVPKAFKKPIFVEQLKAVLTQRGIVSLECKVIGVPTPKLRWYKDDKEIKAGDIFALTANSNDDCLGVYTCEATNVMGTALSTSKIQVTHTLPGVDCATNSLVPYGPPPKIVKGLKDIFGKVGTVLVLECQVEVPPWPRSVGWYNDQGIVNEGSLYRLIADGLGMYGVEIKSLRADHSTTWKCIVTSATGAKTVTSCLVTVSYPKNYRVPRFLESLRAIMTDEGLVSFECKVIGYPTPQLCWFKDGQQLQPGDVYELTGSKSLGSYCCVARNCMGEASSVAELTIEDIQNQLNESEKLQLTSNTQPPRFLIGLKSSEANINESFDFMVKVVTESTPSISWYKEDELITESNRYQFSSEENGTFILNIIPLEIDDQAEWKCVAINKFGQTVTSSFLKLNIPKNFKPPRFLEELRIAFSNEGSVNLECKVIGVPQPQLKWLKDGQELNPGDMHKIISGQSGTCCLGTYTCQAHNCMGTVSSSATLLTMEDKSTVKSCVSDEYLSVRNPLVRNESLSTIPEERTSQMEKSYTIEEPADISFSFDGKEVTVSLFETPDLTHDEALQIIEMYADELSEHISEDNIVDLPSLRIVKQSSISGPVMMEALVIDVPIGFCQQQMLSDTEFDGISLTEDITLANNNKSDEICENSLEYFSDHLSSSNSKRDIFFSASETTPKNSSLILKPQSEDDGHLSFQTPKLFMSDSDDQILTQLNMGERHIPQASRNIIGPLRRSESNNTEEEVSESLAELVNELPLTYNYCANEILTQSDEDVLYSTVLNKIRGRGVLTADLNSEEDDILRIISRPNIDEFLKYMKIILEGTMVKMHTHEHFNFSDTPTELEHSIQALHSLAWKFIEETERDDVIELDKNTTNNVSSLMTAINASLLALEQIDDPFGVSDNILNEIQSSICFDLETLNNRDLSATEILNRLSNQIKDFTAVVNRQVARVTEQRIIAVLRNTIGTTLVYIKTLQQNCSKIKCINMNSLTPLFGMVQPLETILNDIALIEETSTDENKSNLKLKQMLIPPISSIAFYLDNLNTSFKNENQEDDPDLKDIFNRINDSTNQFMTLASQGTESNNLAECFISFTKPINDLCCHLRRFGRSTENIVSSDYGSDDKLLLDFETLFDELIMDIDTLINNVNVVRDSENNMNPLGSLLEPLQDMKIGLFQVNQVLLSNQTCSNMSFEVISCFEHLSHQLIQLNNCIVNQSIVEETNKEIPFESSIKMMQNILFDDTIDDLGVNGILFGSVMKPLLQLQNVIVSKMASVESDISFSEHTDITGGACDTHSLSLSLSNNAQTILDKADSNNLKQDITDLCSIDKISKDCEKDNNTFHAGTSKMINDSTLYENKTKNDLVLKRGFECDIGAAFKDEEPNIITSEDDHENSGFEALFDDTDLEMASDFVEDNYLNRIIHSNVDKELSELSLNEKSIDSVDEENYEIIPKHVLESFDESIEQDLILYSPTDLFDELQETLKNISEEAPNETKEMYVLDGNLLQTNNLPESSPEHVIEQSSIINQPLEESFDADKIKNSIPFIPNELVKDDKLELLHVNTEINQCDDEILKSDQYDTAYDIKEENVCDNDILQIYQNDQLSKITSENIECVDSDKSISNDTVLLNNEISDPLDNSKIEDFDNVPESSVFQEEKNVSKKEDLLDKNESSFNSSVPNELSKINDDILQIKDMVENKVTITPSDLKNQNKTSDLVVLENVNTTELIGNINDFSDYICAQDIIPLENQNSKCIDDYSENQVIDGKKVYSSDGIIDNKSTKTETDNKLNTDDNFIQIETVKADILTSLADKTLIKDDEKLSIIVNEVQKSCISDEVIAEKNRLIKDTKMEYVDQPPKTGKENEVDAGKNKQSVSNDECETELNISSVKQIEGKNDITKENDLVIENINYSSVENIPNQTELNTLNLVSHDNIDLKNKSLGIEIIEQAEDSKSSYDLILINVLEDKMVKPTIDEHNSLSENNVNQIKNISDEGKINEEINGDKISQANINTTSVTDSEQISVSCSPLITCEDTVITELNASQSKEHIPNVSDKIIEDKQTLNNDSELMKNTEENVLAIQQNQIKNKNDASFTNEKVNITEELDEQCQALLNINEKDIKDYTKTDVLISIDDIDTVGLIKSNSVAIECILDNTTTIENISIISNNEKIDDNLPEIIDSKVLDGQLENNNDNLNQNICEINVSNKSANIENIENKVNTSIFCENIINMDNDTKEDIEIKSDQDDPNVFETANDSILIDYNEKSTDNFQNGSTDKIINEEENISKLNTPVDDLKQAIILEANNVTNSDIACEFMPVIQSGDEEMVKLAIILGEEKNALINNEIIAVENTKLIDSRKFEEKEVEIKYEDENKENITYEQTIILDNKDMNKSNLEHLEIKDGLKYSTVEIIDNVEKQSTSEIKNSDNESTRMDDDSPNVVLEQNIALISDEMTLADSTRVLEKYCIDSDNANEKYEQQLQHVFESQKITVINNVMDTEEKIKEQNVTKVHNEKNTCEESLTPKHSDMNNLSTNDSIKVELNNVSCENMKIQTNESIDEKSKLMSSEINDFEHLDIINYISPEKAKEKIISNSEIATKNEIEVSLIKDDSEKIINEFEIINNQSEKEKNIGKTHSSEISNLSNENDQIQDFVIAENKTLEHECSFLIEENTALNNTVVITTDSTQVMCHPNIYNENLEENDVNPQKQVTDYQNLVVLENMNNFEINNDQNNTKSTIMKELNANEGILEYNETSKFDNINNELIRQKSQVLIEECEAIVNEEVIVIDSTQSLKLCDMKAENLNEQTTENLVGSVKIIEPNVLESVITDKNLEKSEQNEINTCKEIITESTDSKNNETSETKLKSIVENILQNTVDTNEKTNEQEGIINVEMPTKTDSISLETPKSESPLKKNYEDDKITENKISNLSTNGSSRNIRDESINDQQNNIPETKSQNVSDTCQDDNSTSENRVNNVINIDKEQTKIEKQKKTKIDEIKAINEVKTNDKIGLSVLEKNANLLDDIVSEDEITDLTINEPVNTLIVKPKLHCVEQMAANQTECVMLENVNILKEDKCNDIKNIVERARVEHELNIAAIGNVIIDYDSIKENTICGNSQQHSMKNAIISTVDDHLNETVLKNVDVLIVLNEDLTMKKENVEPNKIFNDFVEKSTWLSENESNEASVVDNLDKKISKSDESNKENVQSAQLENEAIVILSENINNDIIYQNNLNLKKEEKVVDELKQLSNNVNEIIEPKETLTDIINLSKNIVKNNKKEPTLDTIQNNILCEVTAVEQTNGTNENENIKNESSPKCNKSPSPDKSKNIIKNDSKIDKKLETIDTTIEVKNKNTSDDKETNKILNIKLESKIIKENGKSTPEIVQMENDVANEKEIEKNLLKNDQTVNKENNVLVTDNTNDVDTSKKKRGSKKKKMNPELQNKKSPSPDKLNNTINKDIIEKNTKTHEKNVEETTISSNLTSDQIKKELQEECKNEQDIKQNKETVNGLTESKNVELLLHEGKSENKINEVFINNEEIKNKSQESNDISINVNKIDEKIDMFDETNKLKNTNTSNDKENFETLELKSESEIIKENNKNIPKIVQTDNDVPKEKEIKKNVSKDNQIENKKNNDPVSDKSNSSTDELDKSKKKRGSKKNKTSPEPQEKKSPSPDKFSGKINKNNIKENTKLDGNDSENQNISSNKSPDQLKKKLPEEQHIKKNKEMVNIVSESENVEPVLHEGKINISENKVMDIDINNEKNKNKSHVSDEDKSVVENDKKKQGSVKQKSSCKLQNEKTFLSEKSVKVETEVKENINIKLNNDITQENNTTIKESEEPLERFSQEKHVLENETVGELEKRRGKRNKRRDSKSKILNDDYIEPETLKKSKISVDNKEVKSNYNAYQKPIDDTGINELPELTVKSNIPPANVKCQITFVEPRDKTLVIRNIDQYDTVERKNCDWTYERYILNKKYEEHATDRCRTIVSDNNEFLEIKSSMNDRNRNFESSLQKNTLGSDEHMKRGYGLGKSPSKRYLDVTDAYKSQFKPLTHRSLTPEPRLSESMRYTYSSERDISRYYNSRSCSPYPDTTRLSVDSFSTRSRFPATALRCPSETTIRYYRPDEESLSYLRYDARRRRGSDSFLHDLGARNGSYYSSWRLSGRSSPSAYTEDLNRTKETFRRLYFCVRLIDQTVSSGVRVKFWCSVIGYPEPHVQWYRDGQKLNNFTYNSSTRYQTKYTNGIAQLIVDNVQSGDSGEYTCVAINSQDRVTTTGFLTVYTSPSVFGAKGSVQQSLSVDSFNKLSRLDPHYLWNGDDLRHKSFNNNYDWRLSDDTSRYPKYPKFMTSIIADDIATYGGTIALQVRVQGSPLPNVTWMRESKPLPRVSCKYIYLDEGGLYTLLVKDSTARDGGTYVCRACNLYGTADVEKAIKIVSPQDYPDRRGVKPAIIVSRPNDRLNVAVGEDITVTLRVAGEPKPKVIWMRGSRDVTFLDRSLRETVNDYVKLSIKKAQLSDAGTYFIIAKNVYGSDRAFVTVGVRKRARSLTPPKIRNPIVRRPQRDDCSEVPGPVRSEPTVSDRANNRISLTWDRPEKAETILVYRVESRLESAGEECWKQVGMTPTNCIDVYNLKPSYRYKFRVTARNRFGWGQPVATTDYVEVSEPKYLPEFCQPLPGETKVLLRHSATLQCHVRGVPKPRVTWYKDGEPLVSGKHATGCTEMGKCTLTIASVVDEDAGRYACEAINDQGRVCTLTVVEVMGNRRVVEAERRLQGCLMKNAYFNESEPTFTKRLIDRRVEINSTVRLSCQVNGLPMPLVLWYKDGQPVEFGTGDKRPSRDSDNFTTLELTRVKYDDSGVYTAVASNSIGTASTRCVLEVFNKNRSDPSVPEFLFDLLPNCEFTDSIILKSQIDAYRPVKVEWFRDGVQLRNGRRVDIITDHDGNLELRIACVTKRDSGTYMLKVFNDTGTVESRCEVNVVERKHNDTGLEQISLINHLYSKKPKFVVKPKFQEVEEGQEVVIDSEIVGDPLPNITWLRDGLKTEYYRDNSEFLCVANGNRYQLKIPHAKLTHTGTYTLLAANPHGQIKALISLQVYSTGHYKKKMENGTNYITTVERLPRISCGLVDVECCENDTVAFECKLNITPETEVRWKKDGKLVRLGEAIKSELVNGDTARLEISKVDPLHEGLYTCTAFNELGQDSTSARLILSNSEQTKCTPTNGQRKTMLSSPILAGESNDRSSKRLKRSSAPKFYATLHDRIADVGETVRFQCSVSGHPPPWSSWEKDGVPVGINSRMRIREDDDHRSMEICDITTDDAGLYRITVENKFGKIQATARLEVLTHHQTNDVQITSSSNGRRQSGSTACAGENFTLSCDIRGNPMSDVTWYKNDDEVKFNDRVTSNRDELMARLSISNLQLVDTGMYTCIAKSESGVTKCSTELSVFDTKLAKDSYLQPPIFVEGLVPKRTVNEGKRFKLTVKLHGAVPMSATWYKDDVPIPNCEDFAYVDGKNGEFGLLIVDPFSADSGIYSCKVINTFGEAISHGQLVINDIDNLDNKSEDMMTEFNNNLNICDKTDNQDIDNRRNQSTSTLPATILWGPCDTTVLRGARVVLETSYAGNPDPSVQWLRAGKSLENVGHLCITNVDGISSLTIDSITADDCGKYVVRVDNGLGNDYHFASVAVEGPPDPPPGRPVVSVSETSADVTWSSPAYDGGCMVTGYSVEVRPFNQSDWRLVADKCHSLSHIVRGLAPGESYVFRVRAENMHGPSEASSESKPVYILQTEYGNTLEPNKVNIEQSELFTEQYEVLDELGKGRYGVVHKVKERETGQYFAAKFVRCIKSKDKEKAQEEVDIMNCLRHPKLLQLVAAFEFPREVVMVTEYISGGELFERVVADDFALTEKDCILFTRQLCEGVEYMHKQNVMHLDLKPENIMCQSRTSHQIKIIDFGLAEKFEPGKRVLFGTPEFVPPEIISYEPIGLESDMWSVGVICYVLLSGKSPFMGDNDAETFTNITKAEFDFDDDAFDAVSQDSKDFISALLIKRKELRLTAKECLKHKWLAQQDMDMSYVILSTDKLKKFIIRRKWQKTGNAIRALGRMATLSAASRRGGGGGANGSNGSGVGGGGGGSGRAGDQQYRMASVSEEESAGESSAEQPKTAVVDGSPVRVAGSSKYSDDRGGKGRRSCDARSDSGFSDCSSMSSLAASVRSYNDKPTAIAEETSLPARPRSPVANTTTTARPARPHADTPHKTAAHVLVPRAGTGGGGGGGLCEANRLIFDGGVRRDNNAAGNIRRKEPIRIQTGDNFKKAIAFWKQ